MMRMQYLVAVATFVLVLSGCSSSKEVIPDTPASDLYAVAQQKLQDGNFRAAITQLEALDSRFPFGPYAQQTQLDLIYAYYKSSEYALAQASADRFIRLNPTHSNIDYVFYLRGLTNMGLDENLIQGLLGIDRSDRDPQYALTAFLDFSQLIRAYPNSQYATDASKRLIFLKNRLAKHDLEVAKYYTKRGAYVAVTNRVEEMLHNYPDTVSTRQALPLMENAYRRLNLTSQAEKVARIIAANPS